MEVPPFFMVDKPLKMKKKGKSHFHFFRALTIYE